MHDSGQPKKLWCEAVQAAVFVINRSPTVALNKKTPYEMWYGHKPNMSKLHIWGSKAYSFIPKAKRSKLARSQVCYFVGYGVNGYRLWDSRKQKVYVAREVIVHESKYASTNAEPENNVGIDGKQPIWIQPEPRAVVSDEQVAETEPDNDELVDPPIDNQDDDNDGFVSLEEEEEEDQTRRSARVREPPAKLSDYSCLAFALIAESYAQNLLDTVEEISEKIFIRKPRGFEEGNRVCKLNKSKKLEVQRVSSKLIC